VPGPGHPVTIVDVGANVEVRPEHLVQFGFMGAALAAGRARRRAPARRPALDRRGGHARARRSSSRRTPRWRDRMAEGGPFDFVGNVEGNEVTTGKADVVVTDGFTGNVALKLMEGVSEEMLRRSASRRRRRGAPKAGGLLLRPALLQFRDVIDPRAPAAPTCSACAARRRAARALQPRWHRAGDPARRARVEGDVVGRTHAALGAPAHCAAPGRGVRTPLRLRRHDPRRGLHAHPVASGRRARGRPARIDESTRFKEDLEADSLDLYTLVQELEDSYGVKMSDEQAARILPWAGRRLRRRPRPTDLSPGPPPRTARRAAEDLRQQVFTHASWTERRSDSYARLAFLGDSVLGLAITAHLYPRWRPSATAPGG
jgi:hypothetical protein